MENTKIQILDKNLPLRAYKTEELNRAILMNFLPWLSNLLSLSDKSSADRLEIALPAIKEHCIGMGFAEIKKMFEKYADSKMSIKPIPNYFDRVLLGQIVNEWKSKRPIKKVENTVISDSEKERIMLDAVDRVKKEIQETGTLKDTGHHVYDFLVESGRIEKPSKEKRIEFHKISLQEQKTELTDKAKFDYDLRRQLKKAIHRLGNGNESTIKRAKTLLIIDHFKN